MFLGTWLMPGGFENLTSQTLLQHNSDASDYARAFGVLSAAFTDDSKDKVKAVALEGLAVLNNRMGNSDFRKVGACHASPAYTLLVPETLNNREALIRPLP